jgi:hypothetical protein
VLGSSCARQVTSLALVQEAVGRNGLRLVPGHRSAHAHRTPIDSTKEAPGMAAADRMAIRQGLRKVLLALQPLLHRRLATDAVLAPGSIHRPPPYLAGCI